MIQFTDPRDEKDARASDVERYKESRKEWQAVIQSEIPWIGETLPANERVSKLIPPRMKTQISVSMAKLYMGFLKASFIRPHHMGIYEEMMEIFYRTGCINRAFRNRRVFAKHFCKVAHRKLLSFH